MIKAEQYAEQYLSREIEEIRRSNRDLELPELTVYEKAIIYKYSEDGYEEVNELLRTSKGQTSSEFSVLLNSSLSKLDNYEGQVFRCADLNALELKRYNDAQAIRTYRHGLWKRHQIRHVF